MKFIQVAIIMVIISLIGSTIFCKADRKPIPNTSGNPSPVVIKNSNATDIDKRLDLLIEKASRLEKRLDADREFLSGTSALIESKLSSKQ